MAGDAQTDSEDSDMVAGESLKGTGATQTVAGDSSRASGEAQTVAGEAATVSGGVQQLTGWPCWRLLSSLGVPQFGRFGTNSEEESWLATRTTSPRTPEQCHAGSHSRIKPGHPAYLAWARGTWQVKSERAVNSEVSTHTLSGFASYGAFVVQMLSVSRDERGIRMLDSSRCHGDSPVKRVAFTLALILVGTSAGAADWPQWQGPDRNAISRETGLLKEWPAEGPRLAWRTSGLGGGDSAPAVSKGKLLGMSIRDGKEIVWALAEDGGKELWATPLGNAVQQGVPQAKEGPSCTPAVDGDRLYVIGMGGRVACLSAEDGKLVWERSFTQDFGGSAPAWSYRESPLVDGDQVICTPGGPEAVMVALNKQTGETVWKAKLPGTAERPAGERPDRPVATNRPGDNRPGQPNAPAGNAGVGAPNIEGTKEQGLFLSEHWGMTGFSHKMPNGKYVVKLYFAETYQGITAAGQRVFSFSVQGKEFKDFDIWEKAGGARRAYIESVPVEVTDGAVKITFTPKANSPAIKAIEIIPKAEGAKEADTVRIKAGQNTPFKDSTGQVWLADQGFEGGQLSPGAFNFGGGGFGGGRSGRPGGFGGGPRSEAAYSSVIAIDFEGQRQYVQLTASALIGVSASDGKFLWRYDRAANRMGINCSTPIFQDGLIFAASAYGNGGAAIKLTKDAAGAISANEVYFSSTMQNHHGGMIVFDGCLYGANGGNEGGFLTCLDYQTGKVLWRDRQAPKGSLLLADGRLYLRAESGSLHLIEPSREGLVERGRFEQPDRTNLPAWAHPLVANGKLYIRDQGLLLCYELKSK